MLSQSTLRALPKLLASTALTAGLVLATAASAERVRLTTASGDAAIEGDLVSYEDGIYVVETVIGQMNVADEGVTCEGPGCDGITSAAAEAPQDAVSSAPAAGANGFPGESIVLTSNNGSVRIEGTLVAYGNDTFTIKTVIGTFDVDANGNSCSGPGCPVTDGSAPRQVAVSTRLPTIGGAPEEPADTEETEVAAAAAPAPEPEEEIVEEAAPDPTPEPEPEPVIPQIQFARVDDSLPKVTIAGPASVLDGLLPALAEVYAADMGGSSKLADVLRVDANEAAAAGFPAGKLAALIEGSDTPLAVVGYLTGGSGAAFGSLNDASADIALIATESPMMLVQKRTEAALGNEALVAIVSPQNPVAELTHQQLAGILSGDVTNWAEVGGADQPVTLFGLPASHDLSGARDALILSPLRAAAAEPAQVFATEADLAAALQDAPTAIGLVSHSAVGAAKPLAVGSTCGITTTASAENIRTARYPYSRSLVAISFAAEGPAAKIIQVVEEAGDALVTAAGLEPVTLSRFAMAEDEQSLRRALPQIEDRFQRLNAASALRIMPAAERLGTILTFDGRSNRLDTRSKAELGRIVDYVTENGLGEVMIAGHVNDTGDARADKATARGLAAGVRRALETAATDGALDGVVVRAVGVGSVVPLDCDADAEETLNRRAEVWLRR